MSKKRTLIDKYNDYERAQGWDLTKEDEFICSHCGTVDECKYSWDLYNLGGPNDFCLAEK